MYSIELWRSHFKAIEGHFGTGVTSYFRFIKWLFLVNIPVFLLTLAFVIVPQLMYRYMELGGYNDEDYNQEFQWHDILTGTVRVVIVLFPSYIFDRGSFSLQTNICLY